MPLNLNKIISGTSVGAGASIINSNIDKQIVSANTQNQLLRLVTKDGTIETVNLSSVTQNYLPISGISSYLNNYQTISGGNAAYVAKTGDTMTGPLKISSDGLAFLVLTSTSISFIDDFTGSNYRLEPLSYDGNSYVYKLPMKSGTIAMLSDITGGTSGGTIDYSKVVLKTGSTMTGGLIMNNSYIQVLSGLTNLNLIGDKISFNYNITGGTNNILPEFEENVEHNIYIPPLDGHMVILPKDGSPEKFIIQKNSEDGWEYVAIAGSGTTNVFRDGETIYINTPQLGLGTYVQVTGDTMSGNLFISGQSLNNSSIILLSNPENESTNVKVDGVGVVWMKIADDPVTPEGYIRLSVEGLETSTVKSVKIISPSLSNEASVLTVKDPTSFPGAFPSISPDSSAPYFIPTIFSAGTGVKITTTTATTNNNLTFAQTPWTSITQTAFTMSVNQRYIATSVGSTQLNFTLPSSAAVGDWFEIAGAGSGGWKVKQNASQVIKYATTGTTAGTGGTFNTANQYACAEFLCVSANTFVVRNANGTFTYT